MKVHEWFHHVAKVTAEALGKPWAFAVAVGVIVIWLISGPIFGFSDTWQLIINTATTIVTFLMVFLIQNTQNRDATAIHLKLDELVRAMEQARDQLVDVEDRSEEDLERYKREFREFGQHPSQEAQGSPRSQESDEPSQAIAGSGPRDRGNA